MTLRQKQSIFARNLAHLVSYAYSIGYEITFAWVYRDNGHEIGVHPKRLAADLNLFKDGQYLTETSDHRELGEYWKRLHPMNRWGGEFGQPDGNHYSMSHKGKA